MEPNPTDTILVFRLGPYHFSVGATEVDAIMSPPPVTTIPFAPETVAGSCLFRERTALVINLARKLGLATPPSPQAGQFIFCELRTGTTAFWVDEVIDVSQESGFSWQPMSTSGTASFFNGFLLRREMIILHTSLQALYDLPDDSPLRSTLAHIDQQPTMQQVPAQPPAVTHPPPAVRLEEMGTDQRPAAPDTDAAAPASLPEEELDAFDRNRLRQADAGQPTSKADSHHFRSATPSGQKAAEKIPGHRFSGQSHAPAATGPATAAAWPCGARGRGGPWSPCSCQPCCCSVIGLANRQNCNGKSGRQPTSPVLLHPPCISQQRSPSGPFPLPQQPRSHQPPPLCRPRQAEAPP